MKAPIEQFLREELEYVVVESFDQARAGVALLRDEMGGRATFLRGFAWRNLNIGPDGAIALHARRISSRGSTGWWIFAIRSVLPRNIF